MPRLLDFIGSDALSAHNASFDAKFLLAESARCDLLPSHSQLICSLKLSRRVFPQLGSYKLGALAHALGIRFTGNAHRAEADAEVSANLLIHIGEHLCKRYGIARVDPSLLASVNKLAAAKVPAYLEKLAA
jgi:DNA polymerase-3 subunit epsilon